MGGKSFAQRHKDILKNGGRQKDIDALAKLQEKKAGRNPNTVKLGAGGYYQLGGVDPLGNVIMSDLNMDGIDDFSQGINLYNPISSIDKMSEELNLLGPSGTLPPTSEEEEKKVKKEEKKKKEGQEEGQELFYSGIDPNKYTLSENVVPNPFDNLVEIKVDPKNLQNQINEQLSEEDQALVDKANSNVELTEQEEKALKRLNRNVPGLAIAAGVTQLLPAAYSFFKKDKPVEQMGAPGRIKAPALDRVNFNAERAANAADNRAMNRFIETSGIGPAGIIAKMSAYRRKQEGDMKIAAQESRINTQIANREAQMEMQARTQNVQNALRVNQINTAAREAERIAQADRRLGAVDTFAQGIAGLAGDVMSYQASERLARATGDMGIYERDRLRNFLRNQINPRTGQPYTNADIAKIFNIRFSEAQATKEEDKKEDK